MSERWAAVRNIDGEIVSIGTVIADPLPDGMSVEWVDIDAGQFVDVVDGRPVGVDPPPPPVVKTFDEIVAERVDEELTRLGIDPAARRTLSR